MLLAEARTPALGFRGQAGDALRARRVVVASPRFTALTPWSRPGGRCDRPGYRRRVQAKTTRGSSGRWAVSWLGFPPQSRVLPAEPPSLDRALPARGGFQLAAWGTALLSTIVKWFMRRPRPIAGTDLRVVAAPLGGSSFPSGHVLTYVGIYGWLAIMANLLIRPALPRRLAVASAGDPRRRGRPEPGLSRAPLAERRACLLPAGLELSGRPVPRLSAPRSRRVAPMTSATAADRSGGSASCGIPRRAARGASRPAGHRAGCCSSRCRATGWARSSSRRLRRGGHRGSPGRRRPGTTWSSRPVATGRSGSSGGSSWVRARRWGSCRWAAS